MYYGVLKSGKFRIYRQRKLFGLLPWFRELEYELTLQMVKGSKMQFNASLMKIASIYSLKGE